MFALIVFVILIAAIIFIWPQTIRNPAITLEEAVKTALSDIKVKEKRRIDLIYNLADCVKEYDEHESESLIKIAEKMSASTHWDSSELKAVLSATAYQYPELKSSALYTNLMTELTVTENLIAAARENYNGSVNDYERYIKQFPAYIFLPKTGYINQKYERLDFGAPESAPQDLFGRRNK